MLHPAAHEVFKRLYSSVYKYIGNKAKPFINIIHLSTSEYKTNIKNWLRCTKLIEYKYICISVMSRCAVNTCVFKRATEVRKFPYPTSTNTLTQRGEATETHRMFFSTEESLPLLLLQGCVVICCSHQDEAAINQSEGISRLRCTLVLRLLLHSSWWVSNPSKKPRKHLKTVAQGQVEGSVKVENRRKNLAWYQHRNLDDFFSDLKHSQWWCWKEVLQQNTV